MPVPLTRKGAEKLREELQRLKTIERPKVVQAIAEARAHGDLSENAEYAAAREHQSFLEGRIKSLEATLSNAQIIEPATLQADGRVVFGATVHLLEPPDGKTLVYQIVGDEEADLQHGKISINSPVARALIGKYAGDEIEATVPGGIKHYEIVDVRYE